MLLLNKEQENILDDLQPYEGTPVNEGGSNFQVYAIDIESHEQVAEAYEAICKNHMSASQVFCAYHIFGTRFYMLQDHQDSFEHGAGKVMLDAIKSAKVWNLAIFIVRYHNGPNLGAHRFEIIEELTQQVIARTLSKDTELWSVFYRPNVTEALQPSCQGSKANCCKSPKGRKQPKTSLWYKKKRQTEIV